MRILIYVLGVLATTVYAHELKFDPPEMVNECFRQVNYNRERITELSWNSRLFTCFHACMMEQRGEIENGKINLDKYIANHEAEYTPFLDEDAKTEIVECAIEANEYQDKCDVAALMGKCVSEKWSIITNEGK